MLRSLYFLAFGPLYGPARICRTHRGMPSHSMSSFSGNFRIRNGRYASSSWSEGNVVSSGPHSYLYYSVYNVSSR